MGIHATVSDDLFSSGYDPNPHHLLISFTDWMMHWLATQPSWSKSLNSRSFRALLTCSIEVARRVHVTTRSFGLSSSAVVVEGEPEDGEDVANGNRPISYLPTMDSSHIMWFKKHWMRVTRSTKEGGYYGRREDVLDVWYVHFFDTVCQCHTEVLCSTAF